MGRGSLALVVLLVAATPCGSSEAPRALADAAAPDARLQQNHRAAFPEAAATPPPRDSQTSAFVPIAHDEALLGFTAPSRRAVLSACLMGRIRRIAAREGSVVRAGDVLVELHDGPQRSRTELAAAEAASTLEIEQATVRLAHALDELKRVESLGRDRVATAQELQDARTRAATARLDLELASFRREQAQRNCEQQQQLLDDHRVRAPFDGLLSDRQKEEGEALEPSDGVLTLVQLDPLAVVVDCPLELAARLSPDARVRVTPGDPALAPRPGRVRLVHRVADAASQTTRLRIEVDNRDLAWPAGMRVSVELDAAGRSAARRAAADEVRSGRTSHVSSE